jgi:pimeloyl-ACP methyl ester carboxylesterase
MVPDFVVPVDAIPLGTTGKVNVSKLPAPESTNRFVAKTKPRATTCDTSVAQHSTVKAILGIFSRVLHLDRDLSPHDNFFLCGGHSLLATKVVSLIRRELNANLPFTAILTGPTASELAVRVEATRAESVKLLPNVSLMHQSTLPSPKAFVFFFHLMGGGLAPMVPLATRLAKSLQGASIFGFAWEASSTFKTLDAMVSAYARCISEIRTDPRTPCFLIGWSFGGLVATEVALQLPLDTSHLLILDTPTMAEIAGGIGESDFTPVLVEYILEGFGTLEHVPDQAELVAALDGTHPDRHDVPGLIARIREHCPVPPWVADTELERFIQAYVDTFDVWIDMRSHPAAHRSVNKVEPYLALNLHAARGLCTRPGVSAGLGWSQWDVVEGDHDAIVELPKVAARIASVISDRI